MEFFKKIKCIALMTFRMNWKFNLKFSYIQSKNIYLDIIENKEKGIIFTIKDDGIGISSVEFNGLMYSFNKNENKELYYFQYGFKNYCN